MNKFSTLFLILMILNQIGFAQEESKEESDSKFHFGLNLGGNLSIPYQKVEYKFNENVEQDNSMGIGLLSELSFFYQHSDKISFSYSVGYSLIRHKYEIETLGLEKGHLNLNGIHNNLLLNYKFSNAKINIGIGGYYTYLFKVTEKGTNTYSADNWVTPDMLNDPNGNASDDPLIPKSDEEIPFKRDITSIFNTNDFGLVVELGKQFDISSELKLNSFIRYNQSLVNIYPESIDEKLYNMYLSIGVGISY